MFVDVLRERIGSQCEVFTPNELVSGVLLAVTQEVAVVRTTSYPGYGGEEDVSVRLANIGYVRFFV